MVRFPIKGKLNVTAYDDILGNRLLPTLWKQFVFGPFLFQHDTAPRAQSQVHKKKKCCCGRTPLACTRALTSTPSNWMPSEASWPNINGWPQWCSCELNWSKSTAKFQHLAESLSKGCWSSSLMLLDLEVNIQQSHVGVVFYILPILVAI